MQETQALRENFTDKRRITLKGITLKLSQWSKISFEAFLEIIFTGTNLKESPQISIKNKKMKILMKLFG